MESDGSSVQTKFQCIGCAKIIPLVEFHNRLDEIMLYTTGSDHDYVCVECYDFTPGVKEWSVYFRDTKTVKANLSRRLLMGFRDH